MADQVWFYESVPVALIFLYLASTCDDLGILY
jgi:hypothetical protein